MREQAKIHPELFNLKETLEILSQLQLNSLEVAIDGRNRTKLWAFSSKTSRTQPSNAKYIFGLSVWQRFLIKPEKGRALAYIDFSQQEFGIAAALSGDEKMMDCYREGDPYLTFAKQVGRIPREGTKKTHYNEREAFKQLALAVQFGMGVKALRKKLPKGFDAEGMLKLHKRNFAKYWSWVEHEFNKALFTGIIKTRFGWSMRVDETAKPNTVMNFPMQANGSEILRLSCLLINQKNIKICATIHDAVLIEASVDEIQEHVAIAQECMSEAGRIVLNGFSLRSDATIYAWPFNYTDKRGKEMWEIIREVL
jgi:DNA polymerase I-like protein with 3'-5' exonuclease and polymerase domains